MKRWIHPWLVATGLLGLLAQPVLPAGDYPRDPGIDVQQYIFHLQLEDESDRIRAVAEVQLRFLKDEVTSFTLDLIGRTPTSGDTGMAVVEVIGPRGALSFRHENDRLRVELANPAEAGQTRTVTIRYEGIPRDGLIISRNRHDERTFFGDNWPDRARHWLASVDHPYDKAAVEWVVTAPVHYQVVANGRLVEQSDQQEGMRLTRWREEAPLPTKVMVIGVARFAVEHLTPQGGVPVQSWVYPQDRDAGFYDFAQAPEMVTYFSRVIGPFPYAKLANVQSRTRYGGMENAGAIFYSERSIRGDRSNEGLMAHEIAHQWFGDSVSEADWHHIWLSEGFATYLTECYLEHRYGRERLQQGMRRSREAVIRYARRNPSSGVVDTTITNLNALLSTNSYQKGGWVLHMLRVLVGEEAFWNGIRTFYERHRDANALTADFQAVMEEVSGYSLDWFFRQWIYEPGVPRLSGSWVYDEEQEEIIITLEQDQASGPIYRMPLEIGIITEGAPMRIQVVEVIERRHRMVIPAAAPPGDVVLDPNIWLLFEGAFGGPSPPN